MSEPDISLVLDAIGDLRQSNKESHEAIGRDITGGLKGVKLKIDADNYVTNRNIQDLTREIREHNGRLKAVEESQAKQTTRLLVFDKHVRFMNTLKKRWIIVTLGIILFFSAFQFLYDLGWVEKIIDFLIHKAI